MQDLIRAFLSGEAGSSVAQQSAAAFQSYAIALCLALAAVMFAMTSMRLTAGRGSIASWVGDVSEIVLRTIIALWLIANFITLVSFAQDARREISVAASGDATAVDNAKFADGIGAMIERYRVAILAANGIKQPPPEEPWMLRREGEALDQYLRRVATEAIARGTESAANNFAQGLAFANRIADAIKEGDFGKVLDALIEKVLDATGISQAVNTIFTTVVGAILSIVGAIVALGIVAPSVIFFVALSVGILAIATLPTKAPIAEIFRSGVLDVILSSLTSIAVIIILLKLFEPLVAATPATTVAVGTLNLSTGLGTDLTLLMFMASFIGFAFPIANGFFTGRIPQVNPVLTALNVGYSAAKFALKLVIKVVK